MTDAFSIHPTAVRDPSATIGAGSRVEVFAVIAEHCVLGADCTVAGHVVLERGVVLGDGVRARPGARLLSGTRVGRNALIGENAVLGGNDAVSEIGPDVVIGSNATVLPGVRVSRGAVVEAGSVVADAVPANAIVRGNPARIIGYVGGDLEPPIARSAQDAVPAPQATRVRAVTTHPLTVSEDLRGSLMATEFSGLPFRPARLFTIFGVPGEHIRGSHAHRVCHQLLVCTAGTVSCVVDDGVARDEILLDHPGFGLHLPPMIFATQYKYSSDAVLLVLASHEYDPADYIRDYDEFLELVEPAREGRS